MGYSRTDYRYDPIDPENSKQWPQMPACFLWLASEATLKAIVAGCHSDACLTNRYVPRAKLSPHQDNNERDFSQPVVSVSLGIPAVFLFGGTRRNDQAWRIHVSDGDGLVWGGPSRLHCHGILTLKKHNNA